MFTYRLKHKFGQNFTYENPNKSKECLPIDTSITSAKCRSEQCLSKNLSANSNNVH